jgi:SAM-dependent methyltransferase
MPLLLRKFETRAPSHQNAVDIFEGRWACDFAEACPEVKAGLTRLFTGDNRPRVAAQFLGLNGRLDGMSVLELGPLEAGHTYQLEQLGAESILSIEANAEAFLKCLITKEILGLQRTHFLLGDFGKYLKATDQVYDLVFCSGVLYHMSDPISVINDIGRITEKCFVWTHYFDEGHYPGPARKVRFDPQYPGVPLYSLQYSEIGMQAGDFWGGNQPISTWLSREDMLVAFERAGFSEIRVVEDMPEHPNGASFSFTAEA